MAGDSKPVTPIERFYAERAERLATYPGSELAQAGARFLELSAFGQYSYNYDWMGRPLIQYPQDMVVMQELVWRVRPDLIIETGIAHGGSLIFSASLLALLDYTDALAAGASLDPSRSQRRVVGIDIDIREHNRAAIEAHPMSTHIDMLQGSSIDPAMIKEVGEIASGYERVLVCLDSNHTHEHVLAELEGYAPLTSVGSYCVVYDTAVEDMPESLFPDRPWGPGDNPKTAARAFLEVCATQGRLGQDGAPLSFEVDTTLDAKTLISAAPEGFLRRV